MTTFRTSIFLAGLLLWTGTAFAQEESLDELLEGLEESPSSQEESVDDLLGGFEEPEASTSELLDGFEEPAETPDSLEGLLEGFEENSSVVVVTETDTLSLPTGLSGSTGINISYAYAQTEPNLDKPDYRGLRKVRLYLQLEYQHLAPTKL